MHLQLAVRVKAVKTALEESESERLERKEELGKGSFRSGPAIFH